MPLMLNSCYKITNKKTIYVDKAEKVYINYALNDSCETVGIYNFFHFSNNGKNYILVTYGRSTITIMQDIETNIQKTQSDTSTENYNHNLNDNSDNDADDNYYDFDWDL